MLQSWNNIPINSSIIWQISRYIKLVIIKFYKLLLDKKFTLKLIHNSKLKHSLIKQNIYVLTVFNALHIFSVMIYNSFILVINVVYYTNCDVPV